MGSPPVDLHARLPRGFFARPALRVARDLLGQLLVRVEGDEVRMGRIVETEAYVGEHDLACHSAKGRTARTDVMFGPPGHAYVYLIYGIHDCFNVVTDPEGVAAAVLVRAIEPVAGIPAGVTTDGPGKLCRALGITRAENRADLLGERLFIVPQPRIPLRRIHRGPRIGVDYAGHWAHKPYRFWISDHPHVSVRTPGASGRGSRARRGSTRRPG